MVGVGAVVLLEARAGFPLEPRQWVAGVVLAIFVVLVPLTFVLCLRREASWRGSPVRAPLGPTRYARDATPWRVS
jgi:hypothetical protein